MVYIRALFFMSISFTVVALMRYRYRYRRYAREVGFTLFADRGEAPQAVNRIPRPQELDNSADARLLRWLHAHTSQQAQEKFRDMKGSKRLLNLLSYIGAALVLFNYRNVLTRFLAIKGITQEFSYGTRPSEVMYFQSLSKQTAHHSSKIFIFVHGGAWGSGEPWTYFISSYHLGQCLDCDKVVVVKYPLYPEMNLLGQVECIDKAICHVADMYPTASLILSGHSSGANLCALAVQTLSSPVAAMVLFNGVYDINKHYLWEKSRGVHFISPMGAAAAGAFDACSPAILLANSSSSLSSSFPPTLLVHHLEDVTVPFTSSADFADELSRRGVITMLHMPQGGHADFIQEATTSEDFTASALGQILRSFSEKLKPMTSSATSARQAELGAAVEPAVTSSEHQPRLLQQPPPARAPRGGDYGC